MHALRHVHELLVPGGTLVDSHPVTELQVEAEGRAIGVIEEREWRTVVLPNAEDSLRAAVAEGLYAFEEEVEFDLLQHFDDAEELIDAKNDVLADQHALIRRIRAASSPLITREHYVLRRLRAT